MCTYTRSDRNSSCHICRQCLLLYFTLRQLEGSRVTWMPSNTWWVTSLAICDPCLVKSSKTCAHPVHTDGNTCHRAIRRPQYVTSLTWLGGHLQPAKMWLETTQKQTDHQFRVQSLDGYWVWPTVMRGCCLTATADQVAVDLWNARGKDVGASSQLGCPATAVVPRVSGSGKPPMVCIRGQLVPNLQPLPWTSHISPHCVGGCQTMCP